MRKSRPQRRAQRLRIGVPAGWGRSRPSPPAPPPPMGRPGSPCRGMGRPGGGRAAAAQDGGAAAGPGDGGAGRGLRECGGRRGQLGPRTPQPSPGRPHAPRTRPSERRRRADVGAGARTSGAGRGRRGGPLGSAQRGRHLLRDHQADPRPGAQVLPLPPMLPGGPGAGLGQGAPRPRARPRAVGTPPLGWVFRSLGRVSLQQALQTRSRVHFCPPGWPLQPQEELPSPFSPSSGTLRHPSAPRPLLSSSFQAPSTCTHGSPLSTPLTFAAPPEDPHLLISARVFPQAPVQPPLLVPDAFRTGSG